MIIHHRFFLPVLRKCPSPSPAWGPSRRRQFSVNISRMSSSCRQQFSTKCCKVGYIADGVQSFRCSLGDPTVWVPQRSQVLPGSLFQHGPPMDSQPPLRHPLAPAWESSTGCRGTFPLVPGAPPAPSFSIDLDVRVVPLPCSHPAFLCLQLHLHEKLFFSLLKHVITEVFPPFLMGSALASCGSILELALALLDVKEASSSFS